MEGKYHGVFQGTEENTAWFIILLY